MKVYCDDCQHINFTIHPSGPYCTAPQNIKVKDTYLREETTSIDTPKNLNCNNNCPYFTSKPKKLFGRIFQ